MAFDWLHKFQQRTEKEPDYAEKKLAAYRLGMKAKGSIAGVMIQTAPDCCQAARQLPSGKIYHPDEAPSLPLSHCPQGRHCGCVYRPAMSYEGGGSSGQSTSN
jgi:hypothetical protein